MKIIFCGMPKESKPYLEALIRNGHQILAVLTSIKESLIDKYLSYVNQKWDNDLEDFARKKRIRVFNSNLVNNIKFIKKIKNLNPDIAIVAHFNKILPQNFFTIPKLGTINVHPSLLPKYRGADPVFWQIVKHEKKPGVTIHFIEEKIDAGPIILQKSIKMTTKENEESLNKKLKKIGINLLIKSLVEITKINFKPKSQNKKSTYFPPASPNVRVKYQ